MAAVAFFYCPEQGSFRQPAAPETTYSAGPAPPITGLADSNPYQQRRGGFPARLAVFLPFRVDVVSQDSWRYHCMLWRRR